MLHLRASNLSKMCSEIVMHLQELIVWTFIKGCEIRFADSWFIHDIQLGRKKNKASGLKSFPNKLFFVEMTVADIRETVVTRPP
jgi:hypothetical protein